LAARSEADAVETCPPYSLFNWICLGSALLSKEDGFGTRSVGAPKRWSGGHLQPFAILDVTELAIS